MFSAAKKQWSDVPLSFPQKKGLRICTNQLSHLNSRQQHSLFLAPSPHTEPQTRVLLHNTHRGVKAATNAMRNNAAAKASKRRPKIQRPNAHKCSKCGMNVAGGWGHFNHNKVCTFANFNTPTPCTTTTTVVTTLWSWTHNKRGMMTI